MASGTHENPGENQASVTLNTMGGDYTRMYFTVRRNKDGYEDVTSTKTCSKGKTSQMPYKKTVSKDDNLILNGGNDKWSIYKIDASGTVNFN